MNSPFVMKVNAREKVFRYLFELIETDSFNDRVRQIRKGFCLPLNGLIATRKNNGTNIPIEWKNQKNKLIIPFKEAIKQLCLEFSLEPKNWSFTVQSYVLYRQLALNFKQSLGLIIVHEYTTKKVVEEDEHYPVVLRISPYATKRDLYDFINKVYKSEIKPIQEKYMKIGVRIGKSKKKNPFVEERDNFIYENIHLSNKEIMGLLMKKYGIDRAIDYAYIGKIKLIQKKKRNKV